MADIPDELRYTSDHEWARPVGAGVIQVGITDYAQNSLGDIVFVTVGATDDSVTAGDSFGEVESTKSVSELYAPLTGTVLRANPELTEHPELINSDPYGAGWIVELQVTNISELDGLLAAAAYRDLTAS